MYNQQIKPKKVYLNYNFLKREFQTQKITERTRASSFIDRPILRKSILTTSVDREQFQQIRMQKYCYLFYVDEHGLNEHLKFKLIPILQSFTKNIPNLLEQTYELFLPYSFKGTFANNRFSGEQFARLKDVNQVIDMFHQLKINGEEAMIQRMFDYFFIPSRELAIQILNDIKFQLQKVIKKKITVISYFDGTEIIHACQFGWKPPTLLCAESKEMLLKKLPKIIESIRVSKRIKQLHQFKQQIMQQCAKQLTNLVDSGRLNQQLRFKIKQTKQIQQMIDFQKEYDIQLPKLVVQNTYPKFKIISSTPEIEEPEIINLNIDLINEIKHTNPKISTYSIYKYYIDYKSLCMVNENGVSIKQFVVYNELFSEHSEQELIKIYRALGANIYSGVFKWPEYLLFRILQDNYGNAVQEIDFFLNYLLNDNQDLSEQSVKIQLYNLAQRLNEKQVNKLLNESEGNTFADRFTISILKWMQKNNFYQKGQLNRIVMLEQYEKNEYTFKLVLNCILGQFKNNVLEWFYNIY